MHHIMKGAEPLFLEGNENGFLFIHGFTASPYEGRELGQYLNQRLGLTVSVPLLPGHGTKPEDLKGVSWMDWYNFTLENYQELSQKCQNIFICGQSMGAALALSVAARQNPAGIITLAGAVFLKDWRLILLPLARHIIEFQHKSKGPDIKNKALKSAVPNYSRYPVRSVDEFLKLLTNTREVLHKVTAPALLIHSQKDHTIHFSNLDYIYSHITSPYKEKMVLENSYHVISIDLEKDQVFEKIYQFIDQIIT